MRNGGRPRRPGRTSMLDKDHNALVAMAGDRELCILPAMGNRHGLITGATGTGKTVTLQSLAETFSALGVPVLFFSFRY